MKWKNLNEWLHVIGNFAVVAGLVVVAYEVRQSSVLARGELVATYLGYWQEIDRSQQDVEFARVFAKSLEQPGDLTLAEIIQLDGYYFSLIDQLNIDYYLYGFGIFKDPHEQEARAIARTSLGNPFARSWWLERREGMNPVTAGFIDDELNRFDSNNQLETYSAIRSRLANP